MEKPTERLFQYIWQCQYFSLVDLRTTCDEPIEIIHPGQINFNQGPDFLNARIRISGTVWAGQVELHLQTSDWTKHHHDIDNQYSNVILHVVWKNDREVNNIPVLELHHRVPSFLLDRYAVLLGSKGFIPCENIFSSVPGSIKSGWINRLAESRLSRKSQLIGEDLKLNEYHWEELFWWKLARNFGMQVNADCFELIARSLPLKVLARHKCEIQQLEALLMGQAGMLEGKFNDDYVVMLQKEYRYYRKLYNLHPVNQKPVFLRMRPSNFPTIRLAQLAMLIQRSIHLFSQIKNAATITAIRNLFNITASDYWNLHYRFDELSGFKPKHFGQAMINGIIVNSVCPVLFAYGNYHGELEFRERALSWLQSIPAEQNSTIEGFKNLGLISRTAFDSQALIELKNEFCNNKRCLDCAIGCSILGQDHLPQSILTSISG